MIDENSPAPLWVGPDTVAVPVGEYLQASDHGLIRAIFKIPRRERQGIGSFRLLGECRMDDERWFLVGVTWRD